jgi:hypothetical protein
MILFALDAFTPRGKGKDSILLGKNFRPHKLSSENQKKLPPLIDAAKKAMVDVMNRPSEAWLTKSGTYGKDDPFTLTWLAEIVFRWIEHDDIGRDQLERCEGNVMQAAKRALNRMSVLETADTKFSEVMGSFLKVRRLHLASAAERLTLSNVDINAKEWIDKETPELWEDFDDTIYRHLSYSSIGDQRFDPAELAFSLEGALLLHPNWIGRSTLDEVFEALKLSNEGHPFWRPLTPFLANDQGHILFLISIEVANSILRACEILDEGEGVANRFSQFEPQLRRYAMWLLGEMEEIHNEIPDEPNLVGWHTEYETKRDIQLWHTSHVLVFLVHYVALLKRKIAAEGIDAAGLDVVRPVANQSYWLDEPIRSLKTYAVLAKIQKEYLEPLEKSEGDQNAPKSMLLYGPPGTGKTTLAEEIAARLDRPLIVVTVSDFLAAGAAEIENRAKGVFQTLGAQEEVVILFDEIDQFLLDRNSKFYQDQDDVFKFMTPGMLTKLQNLRGIRNCIFIVATNYYERIDSAIRRRGRIDEHFLLCLPDNEQRLNLLTRFVMKFLPHAAKGEVETALRATKIAEKTVLLGWGDLKHLVESKMVDKKQLPIASFAEALAETAGGVESAVTLSAYRSRFDGKGPFPFEEFFLLVYLLAESNKTLSNQDKETIHQVLDHFPSVDKENFALFLKDRGIRDQEVCNSVYAYLMPTIAEHPKKPKE